MFGISRGRLLLYGLALTVLLGLNVQRLLPPKAEDIVAEAPRTPGALVLPDLTVDPRNIPAQSSGGRDLFARPEPAAPAAEPPPPPAPSPQPDARTAARTALERRLDQIRVMGVYSTAAGLGALVTTGGEVDNVVRGDPLFRGVVVTDITLEGVVVESEELGIRRTLRLGGTSGE
ncbi:MAG: hypothetical protein AAGI50_16790 [Pseudomonadota bacterium]